MWELDPNLPEVKYQADGRLHLTQLAIDIIKKLPVKRFRDKVEFDDVVIRILSQVWADWEKYFSPLVRKPFMRDIRREVYRRANIELADERKDDSRSNTKSALQTDGS